MLCSIDDAEENYGRIISTTLISLSKLLTMFSMEQNHRINFNNLTTTTALNKSTASCVQSINLQLTLLRYLLMNRYGIIL
jgi:hypothetical protein